MGYLDKVKHYDPSIASSRDSIVLEGPSGSGKTRQMRSLVKGGLNVLLASAEKKKGTLRDLTFDEWVIEDYDFPLNAQEKGELVKAGEASGKVGMIQLLDMLRYEDHPYDAVFIDSYMQIVMRRFFLLAFENPRISAKTGNPDVLAAYGLLGNKTRIEMDLLKTLTDPSSFKRPVHVVATWGVEQGEDWEGKTNVVPIADGKMVRPIVPYNFDHVFHLKAKEVSEGQIQYVMYTARTHQFDAKYSAGGVKLPPIIDLTDDKVTLYDVLSKLGGGKVARNSQVATGDKEGK